MKFVVSVCDQLTYCFFKHPKILLKTETSKLEKSEDSKKDETDTPIIIADDLDIEGVVNLSQE